MGKRFLLLYAALLSLISHYVPFGLLDLDSSHEYLIGTHGIVIHGPIHSGFCASDHPGDDCKPAAATAAAAAAAVLEACELLSTLGSRAQQGSAE